MREEAAVVGDRVLVEYDGESGWLLLGLTGMGTWSGSTRCGSCWAR